MTTTRKEKQLWFNKFYNQWFYFKVTQTNPIQALDNHLKPIVSIPEVLLLKSGDDVSIPCNTTSSEQITITWNYETVGSI